MRPYFSVSPAYEGVRQVIRQGKAGALFSGELGWWTACC